MKTHQRQGLQYIVESAFGRQLYIRQAAVQQAPGFTQNWVGYGCECRIDLAQGSQRFKVDVACVNALLRTVSQTIQVVLVTFAFHFSDTTFFLDKLPGEGFVFGNQDVHR